MSKPATLNLAAVTALRRIDDYITAGDFQGAMEVIREAMTATIRVRAAERDANGNLKYEDIPDHRVRLAAAFGFFEFTVAKPAQVLNVNTDGPPKTSRTPEDFARMLMNDWDKMKKIGDEYAEALRKAKPVDVTATEDRKP